MCSESSGSQSQSSLAALIIASQSWSRPSCVATSLWQRLSTTTARTASGVPSSSAQAASTLSLSGTTLPRLHAPSHVTMTLLLASRTRSTMALELKPPKMTECTAPMRTHARHAMASSGTMPM